MTTIPAAGVIEVPDAPKLSSLEFLGQVIENIRAQISSLEQEVANASHGADDEIKQLHTCVSEISSKSNTARDLIGAIFGDSAKLESANVSLQPYGETTRKLDKLIDAIAELENELKEAQYDYYHIVADLLTDVKEQMAPFQAYGATPQVILVTEKVTAIETELKRQVQWSCREIGQLVNSDPNADPDAPAPEINIDTEVLSQIYLIVDVLGYGFRKDLLERFAQLQLIPYEKLFKMGTKYSGLEFLDRRFAWFKRLLKAAEDRVSEIFPANWRLPVHLFREFSRRTTKHLAETLAQTERENPEANAHVANMLKALKVVLTFEAEMKASFEMSGRGTDADDSAILGRVTMAEAFDQFLGPYVQLERKSLEELMSKLMKDEDPKHIEEEAAAAAAAGIPNISSKDPFESSLKMFEFIKGSLKRCTQFSTGMTYLSLSKEFRICLHQYAESLRFRCPSPVSAKAGQAPIYKITARGEQLLCKIVTTAEYCIETVPQLEAIMKKTINPSLEKEIDFSAQIDAFMETTAYTYTVMNQAIAERLDPSLKEMKKTNWTVVDSVGDESKYMKEIYRVLSNTVVRIRACLSTASFTSFCVKLSTMALEKLLETIWQLKRVSTTGAGQMLLDLNGLKTYLLRMPNTRLPEGGEPLTISKVYTTVVSNKIAHIESILKLVCTEDEMLEEMFPVLLPEGTAADLEAVKTMKGSKGGMIIPINNEITDKMGDILNVTKMGAKGAVDEITSGLSQGAKAMKSGLKGTLGDITAAMTGKLFEDASTHSNVSDEGHRGSSRSSTSGAHSIGPSLSKDMKQAFSGFNAALGFNTKKSGH